MSNNLQALVSNTISNNNLNSVDTSLLDGKELEIKALFISGASYTINTDLLQIPGDIECDVLRCGSIITESGSGLGTELINVSLTSSTIDNTIIGQNNPKKIRTTQLDVYSTGTYQSSSIKTDGDINLSGDLTNKRYIRSTGTFIMDNSFDTTIITDNDFNLVSRNKRIYINAPSSIKFSTSGTIEFSKLLVSDTTEATALLTGAVQVQGGMAINKSVIVGNDLSVYQNSTFYKNVSINSNLNIKDNLNVSNEAIFYKNVSIDSNCIVNDRLVLNNVLLYGYYILLIDDEGVSKSVSLTSIINVIDLTDILTGNYTLTLDDSTINGQEILIILNKDSDANLNGFTINITNAKIYDVDNSNPSSLDLVSGGNNVKLIWLADHWQVISKNLV